jgi:ribosomal protein L37AE/L43A
MGESNQDTYPVCPGCGSSEVRKSRGRGIFERAVLRALFRRAYRCDICDKRFYGRRYKIGAPIPPTTRTN